MAIPKHHRDLLAEHGIDEICVTADLSRCLLVYPMPVWTEIEDELVDLPNNDPKARRLQRLYLGHATPMALETTGRVLLTPELREYASIERDVVLIGQGKKLELWSARSWADEKDSWQTEPDVKRADMPLPDALSVSSWRS